jgi:hypothetical protein
MPADYIFKSAIRNAIDETKVLPSIKKNAKIMDDKAEPGGDHLFE